MAHTYLVTGASRGLGAEFVRQLRGAGHDVIAAVRRPGRGGRGGRRGRARCRARRGEARHLRRVRRRGRPADRRAGQQRGRRRAGRQARVVSLDTFEDVFRTNVFGLALLTRALLPLLGRGARRTIVNVSSSLGSMALTQGGFSYAYCASKAALNLLTVHMHKELRRTASRSSRSTRAGTAPTWAATRRRSIRGTRCAAWSG